MSKLEGGGGAGPGPGGKMKEVLELDKLLHSITESKPPVSASKIQEVTKMALKLHKVKQREGGWEGGRGRGRGRESS